MRRSDAQKRFYILLTAAVMVMFETALVIYCLNRYYNPQFRTQLYFRGHVLMALIYIAMAVFVGRVFGGLLIGLRKCGDVIFSQLFTILFSNLAFYVLMVLQAFKFPNVIPLIRITVIELIAAFLWIWIMSKGYSKLFKPVKTLLIYEKGSVEDFKERLEKKTDTLSVTDFISADEDFETLKKKIDEFNTVIIADISTSKRNGIFNYCYKRSKRIYSVPDVTDIIFNGATAVHLFDTPLLLTDGNPIQYEERVIKRTFDIIFSVLLIVVLSPLMLLTALIIKLSDGGPVLYKQIRCTKNSKEFKMLKFRSMIVNAEREGVALLAQEKDPRITPVGAVIRKLRIDELPQLFNVLIGDMSFVGPRPERPEFIKKYVEEIPEFEYRTKMRAGITGYAQLYGKYNTKPYDKLKFDLYYMEQYSLRLDMQLMILTLKIIFTKESTEGVKEDESDSGIDSNTGS